MSDHRAGPYLASAGGIRSVGRVGTFGSRLGCRAVIVQQAGTVAVGGISGRGISSDGPRYISGRTPGGRLAACVDRNIAAGCSVCYSDPATGRAPRSSRSRMGRHRFPHLYRMRSQSRRLPSSSDTVGTDSTETGSGGIDHQETTARRMVAQRRIDRDHPETMSIAVL